MSKRLKNAIIFGIFILILFISTLTGKFSANNLWSQSEGISSEFGGLLFKDPADVLNLTVQRSIDKSDGEDIVKYDVEFIYQGQDSDLRILGTPVRQVFFGKGLVPSHSVVNIKGDYDKINDKLFNEKLSLNDYYKKTENYEFTAKSQIRLPLENREEAYSFTLYYKPRDLMYKSEDKFASMSVFITNARVDKFTNSQKMGENENPTFSESGFYVNAQEVKNDSKVSRVSLFNNVTYLVFVVSVILVAGLIWLDKKSLSKLFIPLFMLIILTFYKFLGLAASTPVILIVFPILSYIGTSLARLMTKDTLKLTKKELKQNLAYTIAFFVFMLVVIIIPRAM
ncbi:hypothetical protein [Peptoniphilus catoniae]|uniref:hypothetical protein n=1 Tax=Peptoniphilus catoniae TaxID=1660341 RepID=UPI0010FEC278|nr:hypothetical protein [Peptoniphilus catoniae]